MARATKAEIAAAREEQTYWREVVKWVPTWTVMGWTYKQHATYLCRDTTSLVLTGTQRDQLIAAFEAIVSLRRARKAKR